MRRSRIFLFLDLNGDQKPDLVLLEDGDLYPESIPDHSPAE